MKKLILLICTMISISANGQGLIFEGDRDRVLEGPSFFKLGKTAQNELVQISSEQRFFSKPLVGKNPHQQSILNELLNWTTESYRQQIACTGKTEELNGTLYLLKVDVCVRISDGRLLVSDQDLSVEKIQEIRWLIDDVLWERLGEDELNNRINDSRRSLVAPVHPQIINQQQPHQQSTR